MYNLAITSKCKTINVSKRHNKLALLNADLNGFGFKSLPLASNVDLVDGFKIQMLDSNEKLTATIAIN